LVGAENLGDRSAPQFRKTRMAGRLAMLADMLRQQPRGPEFLGIAQILRFLAGQRHHPGARFGRHRWAAATARQVGQGLSRPQIQGLAYAPFDPWPVRRQAPGDLGNRLARVIAQQNRSPLHAACRLASGLRQRGQHFQFLVAQLQLGPATDEWQATSLLVMVYKELIPQWIVLQYYFGIDLLEDELDRQLQQSRRPRLQDLTERGGLQVVLGQTEIRMVQQVEALRPELHAPGLADVEVPEQRKIDVFDSRTADHIAALVTEL